MQWTDAILGALAGLVPSCLVSRLKKLRAFFPGSFCTNP
jgi:hypothetical protein